MLLKWKPARGKRVVATLSLLSAFITANLALAVSEHVLRDGGSGQAFEGVTQMTGERPMVNQEERARGMRQAAEETIERLLVDLPSEASAATPAPPFERLRVSTDRIAWQVENVSLLDPQMWNRQAGGPYLVRQVEPAERYAADALRVLVVGDSFSQGEGVEDLDMSIPYQIERILNERTRPGTYQVTVFGRGNAGLSEYASWLTPEKMQEVNPDLVLVLFNENDALPDSAARIMFDDSIESDRGKRFTMSVYNECMSGRLDVFSRFVNKIVGRWYPATAERALEVYCDTSRLSRQYGDTPYDEITSDPSVNPYRDRIEAAAGQIVENAGSVPVLALPLSHSKEGKSLYGQHRGYPELLGRAGMTVARPDQYSRVDELYGRAPSTSYAANPADLHFGTALADAFAQAGAALVLEAGLPVPVGREIDRERSIVTNFLPDFASMRETGTYEVQFGYDPNLQSDDLKNYLRVESEDGKKSYSLAPCMRLGRPHLRIMLDQGMINGKVVHVELMRSEVSSVSFTTVGYDEEMTEVIAPLRELRLGSTLSFLSQKGASGIMVGTTDAGCPLDEGIEAPKMVLRVWVE